MGKKLDLTGERFGRLTVLGVHSIAPRSVTIWLCKCECGAEVTVRATNLRAGNTNSCGCLRKELIAKTGKEKARTHGLSSSREYWIYHAMKSRCLNPKSSDYPRYGGRGIKVCDRWQHSFENFYADMGPRPSDKHSIERRENNGNYEPSNCYWATASEQNKNKRYPKGYKRSIGQLACQS